MKSFRKKYIPGTILIMLIFCGAASAAVVQTPEVATSNAGLAVMVAPGELLPISVALSNFGSSGESAVDVSITYAIFSSTGAQIFTTTDTVAVETTADFIKTVQIPVGTAPGTYTAKTSIIYGGQLVPASTQFTFTVERKIFGLFQSQFYFYGCVTLVVSILVVLLCFALMKRARKVRLVALDYSDIPHDVRTFYEIISDTIMTMRGRVGDDALVIASRIPGLSIDSDSGRVLALTGPPAKIIAELVSEYDIHLGKKVSFSLRQEAAVKENYRLKK